MIEIRPATPADVGEVLALWAHARSAHAVTPDTPEVLEALIAHDPEALLVARDHARIVGTLIAAWDGWRGNLYRLAVAPEQRRRGIATALVREGERRLTARGANRISVLAGRTDDPATALWRAAGYAYDEQTGRFVRNL